ncbi:hypothetical protein EON83_25130 [bacterium]|nr:MAG: hypothetical protein EON83_25130 [bacterium]
MTPESPRTPDNVPHNWATVLRVLTYAFLGFIFLAVASFLSWVIAEFLFPLTDTSYVSGIFMAVVVTLLLYFLGLMLLYNSWLLWRRDE